MDEHRQKDDRWTGQKRKIRHEGCLSGVLTSFGKCARTRVCCFTHHCLSAKAFIKQLSGNLSFRDIKASDGGSADEATQGEEAEGQGGEDEEAGGGEWMLGGGWVGGHCVIS